MNEDNMLEKIKFINDNKELIKNDLLVKLKYKNKSENLLHILILFLLNPNDLEDCAEYKVMNKYLENKIAIHVESSSLNDIIGTINYFINKVYGGNMIGIEIINRININTKIVIDLENKHTKTMVKAI